MSKAEFRALVDPLLKVTDLQIRAGDTLIVDRVSFDLKQGHVLGLIGESGAGKSTIGLAALGFVRGGVHISGGRAELNGKDILALPKYEAERLRGAKVTYVAQSAAASFNPAHKLIDQVVEASLWHGVMTRTDAIKRAQELFALLGLPDPEYFGQRYPHQVSGGQLQRAMTAMALCPRPELVVFDEPTTALDVTTQIEVLAAIKNAVAVTNTAALYISHDLAVVAQIADEIMVLRHGRMVEYGPAAQIFSKPEQDYTRRLISVRQTTKRPDENVGDILLRINGVDAGYASDMPVLFDVNLEVRKGQTLAIVGESGSGKSTLARVVTGLLSPLRGDLSFDGQILAPSFGSRSAETLRDVQIISQIPDLALNPRQTVRDIIGRPLSFYFRLNRSERKKRTESLIDQIEMPSGILDRYPAELSGGQKQRVCIARALAASPQLIVCDEPTSALDPLVAEGILDLLSRLQRETATSYLFITHDLAIVRAIADTVAVMHRGRVVRYGKKTAVFSPPFDSYTEKLLGSIPEMRPGWLDEVIAKREAAGFNK